MSVLSLIAVVLFVIAGLIAFGVLGAASVPHALGLVAFGLACHAAAGAASYLVSR